MNAIVFSNEHNYAKLKMFGEGGESSLIFKKVYTLTSCKLEYRYYIYGSIKMGRQFRLS